MSNNGMASTMFMMIMGQMEALKKSMDKRDQQERDNKRRRRSIVSVINATIRKGKRRQRRWQPLKAWRTMAAATAAAVAAAIAASAA